MENTSKVIKKCIIIYQAITKKAYNNQKSFPGGGKDMRMMENFVNLLSKEYGNVSNERIVDYCVSLLHYRQDTPRTLTINLVFGKASIDKYKRFNKGKRFFEDKWLQEYGLERTQLLKLIKERTKHSLSKYIYIEAEDVTKSRSVKLWLGPSFCERTTTLFTPFSPICQDCKMKEECIENTKRLFPELYRIRMDKWQKMK